MALLCRYNRYGNVFDGLQRQGGIAAETLMFWSHLARPVGKLPRGISQNGAVGTVAYLTQKVLRWG